MTHIVDNINIEQNIVYNSLSPKLVSTPTTLNGTTSLTNQSSYLQVFTGTSSGYSVILPDSRTLTKGWKFEIWNTNSVPMTLKYSDGTTSLPIPSASYIICTMAADTTQNGSWLFFRAFTGTASGILNYNINSATPYNLSSGTADVLVTGMTATPVAGTYAVWYNGSLQITGNNTVVRTSVFYNNSIVTDSLRTLASSVSTFNTIHITMTTIQVDGFKTVEIRVARDSNSLTITGRSMILIRTGD